MLFLVTFGDRQKMFIIIDHSNEFFKMLHSYDLPLRSVTNVTYGDGLYKIVVVSVYSDGPLRFVTKAIFNDTFGEGR